MATSFEELMNNMVNASLGVAAVAADKGKELLDDLTARGAQVRADAAESDFSRSMADAFERAGGTFHDVTERVSAQGANVAERILDELILARVRPLSATKRAAFIAHVEELVANVPDAATEVPVEGVEPVEDEEPEPAAEDGATNA
ncbi:hypothetical protein [uncultured Enorma sp.]|uniref:hypothetical protein n=1 Tax=uncultured Enorma sp. TaxID=1714346 RepID=UPI00265F5FA6|nr:hypothetical protein [uncultured Enorma sp.]